MNNIVSLKTAKSSLQAQQDAEWLERLDDMTLSTAEDLPSVQLSRKLTRIAALVWRSRHPESLEFLQLNHWWNSEAGMVEFRLPALGGGTTLLFTIEAWTTTTPAMVAPLGRSTRYYKERAETLVRQLPRNRIYHTLALMTCATMDSLFNAPGVYQVEESSEENRHFEATFRSLNPTTPPLAFRVRLDLAAVHRHDTALTNATEEPAPVAQVKSFPKPDPV